MRRRLYFSKDAKPYQAGHWYDNVSDATFRTHTKSGAAESVYAQECRCLVTHSGLLVREGGTADQPCVWHAKSKRAELSATDTGERAEPKGGKTRRVKR